MKPETFYFEDDGSIPNNDLPLLLYRNAFSERGNAGAKWLERMFKNNNWMNSWRNGVYPFHHYHSTSHEVLGIYSGEAKLHLGGEQGEKLDVKAGDVIVIPAGVGHKNLGSENLGVVGAYPNGRHHDLLRGEPDDRPEAIENINSVPLPSRDPLLGKDGGVSEIWG
ncbi:cupin domain-containing protein [Rhodohalobacter sp. 8-1]|uniref:cupin domain-containing protein n=1 Tax=Rhodohalobacter sp. 8-1 TaxID=3131972 RepID=UPI0030EBE68B